MATMKTLLDRTRLELGDQAKTFRQHWFGDGVTNRWELDYQPLDSDTVVATIDGVDVSGQCEVEEASGVLVFDTAPGPHSQVVVTGTYYRYFTTDELLTLLDSAVLEHLKGRVTSYNQSMTLENLPPIEEGVVAQATTVKALYVLATDASFDIDILTPDGVSIPRSERYRQLLEMIETRKAQHKEICEALNIGVNRVEVFTLRRVSKMTNKYVPVFRPQEIDDWSRRERVYLPIPTYGASPVPTPAKSLDLAMVQGDSFLQVLEFGIPLNGYTIQAQVRTYPQNPVVAAEFACTITDEDLGLATVSLTPDQTRRLPLRSFWDVQVTKDDTVTTVVQGSIFTSREVTRP